MLCRDWNICHDHERASSTQLATTRSKASPASTTASPAQAARREYRLQPDVVCRGQGHRDHRAPPRVPLGSRLAGFEENQSSLRRRCRIGHDREDVEVRTIDHAIDARLETAIRQHVATERDGIGINTPVRSLAAPGVSLDCRPGTPTRTAYSRRTLFVASREGVTDYARVLSFSRRWARPFNSSCSRRVRSSPHTWLESRGVRLENYAFPSRSDRVKHISTRQYARRVHEWVSGIGPRRDGLPHTFATADEGLDHLQGRR